MAGLPLLAFNIAQIARLHGTYLPSAYKLAEIDPISAQHRVWQSSSAALIGCDFATANRKLTNLPSTHQSIDIQRTRLNTALLIDNLDDAWHQFKSIHADIDLPPSIAARLSAWLIQNNRIDPKSPDPDVTNLFGQAVGISTRQRNLQWIGFTLYQWIVNKTPAGNAILQRWQTHLTNRQSHPSLCQPSLSPTQNQNVTSTISDQTVRNLIPELNTSVLTTRLFNSNDFEAINTFQDFAQGWTPIYMASGNPWNFGVFDVSIDNTQVFKGQHAVRIDGLYIEQKQGLEPTRAGLYSDELLISSNAVVIVSLVYKTSNEVNANAVSLYISGLPNLKGDRMFPKSPNRWQRLTLALWNPANSPQKVRFNLRLWSTGTVWFDDFSIHEVHRVDGQPIPPRDPIIDIRPAE